MNKSASVGTFIKRLLLEKTWCWERLKAGVEGDDREWGGWMASLTKRTWVWVNSGSWWWTGRPGVLQSTGSQRLGHDWATELNWLWKLWDPGRRFWTPNKAKTEKSCFEKANTHPVAGLLHTVPAIDLSVPMSMDSAPATWSDSCNQLHLPQVLGGTISQKKTPTWSTGIW